MQNGVLVNDTYLFSSYFTQHTDFRKANRLVRFGEVIGVGGGNHKRHISALREQIVGFMNVEPGGAV